MSRFGAGVLASIAMSSTFGPSVQASSATDASWSARIVCEYRAVAAQHPDPKLRNRDYLAARLCDTVLLPRGYEAARDVIDVDPEAYAGYFYVNARTHQIDDLLDRAAAHGITQVVVLGAGFDSRAYRFARTYPRIKFFEVDLPATIRAKQDVVTRALGALPPYVRYTPIDFNSQTLVSALEHVGYDATKKTLFILEGVTMYITGSANEAVFQFFRVHAASGSVVVFDYIWRRVVEGDYQGLYGASSAAKGLVRIGEPYISGWSQDEMVDFTRRHGLRVVESIDAAELTRRHLLRSDGTPDGRIPEWYGMIEATVP